MPRFEDLMDKQGRIRLRTRTFPNDLLHQQMSFCRGWCLRNCRASMVTLGWDVDLLFEFAPDRQSIIVLTETSATPFMKYPDADFDAMLAALEPYELVQEANPDVCPQCQSTAWRHFEETPNLLAFRVCYFCGHKEPAPDTPLTVQA